jgi:hypothetical protein
LQFNPKDLCLAVGSTDKVVRYWELQDYSLVSQTTIENSTPSRLLFDPTGRYAFVAFSEFIKLYILENDVGRCHLLDVIPKSANTPREVLDLKLSFGEQGYLFLCEQQTGSQALLSQIPLADVNFDPKVKPQFYMQMPSTGGEQKPHYHQALPVGTLRRAGPQHESQRHASLLAQNGLSLLGHGLGAQEQSKGQGGGGQTLKNRAPSTKTFYQESELKIEEFINEGANSSNSLSEAEQVHMMSEALKDHSKVYYIMKHRNEILEALLKHWQKNEILTTVSELLAIKDQNIFCDALACTFAQTENTNLDLLTLDHLSSLLTRCQEVL